MNASDSVPNPVKYRYSNLWPHQFPQKTFFTIALLVWFWPRLAAVHVPDRTGPRVTPPSVDVCAAVLGRERVAWPGHATLCACTFVIGRVCAHESMCDSELSVRSVLVLSSIQHYKLHWPCEHHTYVRSPKPDLPTLGPLNVCYLPPHEGGFLQPYWRYGHGVSV